jgi:protein-S-isoprenylcysteine O-methyltransferase Ste14
MLLDLDAMVRGWAPQNEDQRTIRSSVTDRLQGLLASRWTISQEAMTTIPGVFVLVLIIWLTLIFISFGLFAPSNTVVVGALLLCSLSIAGALFIIMEMSGPFDGLVVVQPKPLVRVLDFLTTHACAKPG